MPHHYPSDLIRLLGQMESEMKTIHTQTTHIRSSLDTLELRIRRIEHQTIFWKGGIGVIIIIASMASTFIPLLRLVI